MSLDHGREGHEDWVGRLSLEALVEFIPPPGEKSKGIVTIPRFISKIIGPAAEGVDRADAFEHAVRDVPAEDAEILAVGQRQVTAITRRLVDRDGCRLVGTPCSQQLDDRNACLGLHRAESVPWWLRVMSIDRMAFLEPFMRLIMANPRGFCAGVYMAIDVVDQLLDILEGEPIYVYHEIVHNKHVVNRFIDRGVTFVEQVEDVPPGSIIVFSAHGVSPAVRKAADERNLTSIDATCPLVTKVHAEAIRYARRGWQILLVGHEDHQEVIGTRGEAPDSIQVVDSVESIARLDIDDPAKLIYLTQTTLSMDDANQIIDALKETFPEINSPPSDDICYATTNRQHAVRALAPGCDLVLVVGSANSSNSVRLTEIAEASGTRAVLIDDRHELTTEMLKDVGTVLVTAGASAPEDLVQALILELVEQHDARIEQHDIFHESVEFGLPGTLKTFMRSRDVDPEGRRITMDDLASTNRFLDRHGIPYEVHDLTVGASD